MKIVHIRRKQFSYLLNDLRNFNEIFRNDVALSENSKNFALSLENKLLEKPQGRSNLLPTPQPF